MSRNSEQTSVESAIAAPDGKVDPGDVPLCEFTGGVKAPQTDGKLLLAFTAPDGGTVAVRLTDEEWRQMAHDVEAVGVSGDV